MSILFKSVEKRNPLTPLAPPKFYARAISRGTSDIDRLSALVADGSTVRQADVYAVIVGLVNAIQGEISQGRNVQLGKLGTFRVSLSSEGAEEESRATASQIRAVRIRYRPGKELQNLLKTLDFTKVSNSSSDVSPAEPEETPQE